MNSAWLNKKVLVMGLGLNGGGLATANWFHDQGAVVTVTDLKTAAELEISLNKLSAGIKLVLGEHQLTDFQAADLVVPVPSIKFDSPYLVAARQSGAQVMTATGLFCDLVSNPLIVISGTKGKTTSAHLTVEILKTKFPEIKVGGNLGVNPLTFISELADDQLPVVLELSSWQIEWLTELNLNLKVVAMTNLLPDHLNHYSSLSNYYQAKAKILKHLNKDDHLIINSNDNNLKQWATEAEVHFFSSLDLENEIANPQLPGKHNLENMALARQVGVLFDIPDLKIKQVLQNCTGVADRLELVEVINQVSYYNDTTATIPTATLASLNSFPEKNITLIAGGVSKNIDYQVLSNLILKKCQVLILLKGSASQQILSCLELDFTKPLIFNLSDLEMALQLAQRLTPPQGVVLFSPGAASFNLFENEFDRGRQFREAVLNFKG